MMRPMRDSAREHPPNRPPQTIGARVPEVASGGRDRLRPQRHWLTAYFGTPPALLSDGENFGFFSCESSCLVILAEETGCFSGPRSLRVRRADISAAHYSS